MGFGHAVYRTMDPRATVLSGPRASRASVTGRGLVGSLRGDAGPVYEQKQLWPNVDLYAAGVYHVLGIPTDLMTPIFALARMAGWTAHVREQYADNKVSSRVHLRRPTRSGVGPDRRALGQPHPEEP